MLRNPARNAPTGIADNAMATNGMFVRRTGRRGAPAGFKRDVMSGALDRFRRGITNAVRPSVRAMMVRIANRRRRGTCARGGPRQEPGGRGPPGAGGPARPRQYDTSGARIILFHTIRQFIILAGIRLERCARTPWIRWGEGVEQQIGPVRNVPCAGDERAGPALPRCC